MTREQLIALLVNEFYRQAAESLSWMRPHGDGEGFQYDGDIELGELADAILEGMK